MIPEELELYKHNIIVTEWSNKNPDDINPFSLSRGSSKRCWWKCKTCGYEWEAEFKSRFGLSPSRRRGCKKCKGRVVSEKNCLLKLYPELKLDWDEENNGHLLYNSYSFGSNKEVKWICHKCGHKWSTAIKNRTKKSNGCPQCSKSGFDSTKEGYLYIFKIIKNNNVIAVKYGITNLKPKDRLYDVNRKSKYDIELYKFIKFQIGKDALSKENKIKNLLKDESREYEYPHKKNQEKGFICKTNMKDGFTETVSINHLNKIEDIFFSTIDTDI